MKKAKIYKPSKTATQSGLKKFDKWIIEYITDDPGTNPLMGWESSTDTMDEINLKFSSKEKAIEYAKKNDISYKIRFWFSFLLQKLCLGRVLGKHGNYLMDSERENQTIPNNTIL